MKKKSDRIKKVKADKPPVPRPWGKWTKWHDRGEAWLVRMRYRGGIGIDQFFEKHTQYRPKRRKGGR